MSPPTVGILYAPGTNSHRETAYAFERVGGVPEYVMMSALLRGDDRLDRFDLLCIPGGFSYGDHLGAGKVAGLYLRHTLAAQLAAARQRPIIAICNGYQIAVRAGLFGDGLTLTVNAAGTFRNIVRQPHVVPATVATPWLAGLEGETIHFPCAHGEGRFEHDGTDPGDRWAPALSYPAGQNPDGSADDIAGITSGDGLVFGLMDHPERAPDEPHTVEIFRNGVLAARS